MGYVQQSYDVDDDGVDDGGNDHVDDGDDDCVIEIVCKLEYEHYVHP